MQGDFLTQVMLPAGLMLIMFSLGIGLSLADFRRVFASPRAFVVGFACHFLLLPLVTFAVVSAWGITGALAVGFMIVAACPTGTTSNLLTYYARGDVALALSFTAIAGVVSIVSVPLVITFALDHFVGAAARVEFPVGAMMAQIFLVMGLPVAAGMGVRARWPAFAARRQALLGAVSGVIFVVIVAASIARHWALFVEHTASLAPLVFTVNACMLLIGYGLSRAAGVARRQAATVAIESSVQNTTLAFVIASTLLRNDTMVLPAAIYSLLMYLTGFAFICFARQVIPPPPAQTGTTPA